MNHRPYQFISEFLIGSSHGAHQMSGGIHQRLLRHQTSDDFQRAVLNVRIFVVETAKDVPLMFGDNSRVRIEQKGQRVQREKLNIRIGIFEHVFQFIHRLSNNLLLRSHALDNRSNAFVHERFSARGFQNFRQRTDEFLSQSRLQRRQSAEYFNQFNRHPVRGRGRQ